VAPPPAPERPAAAEAAAAPAALAIEDAPAYPATGFRKAAQEDPTCVQRSVRIPRDLAGRISGPITVRFAVGPDGSVSLFQVQGDVQDRRIGDAIRAAVESCKFIPGTDPQGRPTRLWLVMPVRFVGQ
jgi:TonB family protein